MTAATFRTAKEARDAGWFSRRHQTPDANTAARERYQRKAKPAARIERGRRRRAAEMEQAA